VDGPFPSGKELTGWGIDMSEYFGVKVEDLFNTMPERFRAEGAEGVDASSGMILREREMEATVKDRKMKIEDPALRLRDCHCHRQGRPLWGSTWEGGCHEGLQLGQVQSGRDFGALAKTGKMFRKYVPPKGVHHQNILLDMFGTLEKRFQPAEPRGLDVSIGYDIGGGWGQVDHGHPGGKCVVKEGLPET
jgi:hypothetical protein